MRPPPFLISLSVAIVCFGSMYIGAQNPEVRSGMGDVGADRETTLQGVGDQSAGTTILPKIADDAVVVIANHHWLPSDGEYSKEGDVTIYPGGVIKFKKGLTIDDGAKRFWAAVSNMVAKQPCDPTVLLSEGRR